MNSVSIGGRSSCYSTMHTLALPPRRGTGKNFCYLQKMSMCLHWYGYQLFKCIRNNFKQPPFITILDISMKLYIYSCWWRFEFFSVTSRKYFLTPEYTGKQICHVPKLWKTWPEQCMHIRWHKKSWHSHFITTATMWGKQQVISHLYCLLYSKNSLSEQWNIFSWRKNLFENILKYAAWKKLLNVLYKISQTNSAM